MTPKQKPGKSEQTVCTPQEFIEAVRRKFGHLRWDLACNDTNSVADIGVTEEMDSFTIPWNRCGGIKWLNPPFGKIEPWVKKASEECTSRHDQPLLILVPASVGSNWYAKYVYPFATTWALSPRIKFTGHATAFPKDLMLLQYGGLDSQPGTLKLWRWQ